MVKVWKEKVLMGDFTNIHEISVDTFTGDVQMWQLST